MLGDFETSLVHADRAVAKKADSPEAYCQRGEAKHGLQRYREAVADFTRAIELKKDYETAHRERALSYAALGEEEKARQDELKADDIKARSEKK
jgi:tetratricopeptide (TPR) repeat protein